MGGRADGRADATAMVVIQLATAARRLWQFMAKYRKSTKYEGLCVTIFFCRGLLFVARPSRPAVCLVVLGWNAALVEDRAYGLGQRVDTCVRNMPEINDKRLHPWLFSVPETWAEGLAICS